MTDDNENTARSVTNQFSILTEENSLVMESQDFFQIVSKPNPIDTALTPLAAFRPGTARLASRPPAPAAVRSKQCGRSQTSAINSPGGVVELPPCNALARGALEGSLYPIGKAL